MRKETSYVGYIGEETKSMDTFGIVHDLELSHLRRFVAVVDYGTFVGAAEELCISQQALSTSIAKMEELAGVTFLDRKRGGRIALTVFGRLLLGRARPLIALADQASTEISLLRNARGGSVSLGIGETMTGRNVAAAVRRFHRERPDVQIQLIEGYTEKMISLLLKGEVDFVVGGSQHEPVENSQLEFQHLFMVRDVLVVRHNHPLAGKPNPTLADLANFTWIVPMSRGDVYKQIKVVYGRVGLMPPHRIIRSDAIVTGTSLFLDDDYIMTTSPDMVEALCSRGVLTKLAIQDTTLLRSACVITRRGVHLSAQGNRLREEIILECERLYLQLTKTELEHA